MARKAGFDTRLYYSPTVIAVKDANTVPSAANSSTEIIDVADMATVSKVRNIIDIPVYGQDTMGKLPGQADPGTFDFNVTLNFDDAIHVGLRDDDGKTEHTFILEIPIGAANTVYAAFDGYVAEASVGTPIDDRIQMDVSIAVNGSAVWVDA